MLVANLSDAAEITGRRWHRPHCCADHGLSYEGGNGFRTEVLDSGFEFVGRTTAVGFIQFL